MLASEDDHPLTKVTSNPVAIGLPTAIRPPARYPSIQQPSTGRNRSPSSSTAFSDLAHQGPFLFPLVADGSITSLRQETTKLAYDFSQRER